MLGLKTAVVALLAGAAAATPLAAAANGLKTTLYPARHPECNPKDVTNLQALHDVLMHYDSDDNPHTDSAIATLSAPGAPYPIVQLENTDYIKSVECTTNEATIVFNNKTAYQAAVADWQQHPQFVLFSYNPNCGSGYAKGTRDFVLVNKVTPNDATMTVEAAMQFVDYQTAIGNNTMVHASIGSYRAPVSKRWSKSKSTELKWNKYPADTLTTQQFGSGLQLLQSSDLDVICAGCGTDGDLTLTGEVDFSWFSLKSASISLKGSMEGTLALGMVARGLSHTFPIANHQIAQIPLGAIEIPEVLTIGPQIDINVGASVTVEATGSMLLGASLKWDSVDVELGLTGDSTHQGNGLTPSVTPKFNAQGEVSATLDLSLPISVGIGINILDGTWNKSLSIIDTPGFQLKGEKANTAGSCSGVELSADLYNNVGADILDVTTIALASFTQPLFSTCLGGGASTPATTPATTPSVVRSTRTTTVRRASSSPAPAPAPVSASTPASAVTTAAATTSVASSTAQKTTSKKASPPPAHSTPAATATPAARRRVVRKVVHRAAPHH